MSDIDGSWGIGGNSGGQGGQGSGREGGVAGMAERGNERSGPVSIAEPGPSVQPGTGTGTYEPPSHEPPQGTQPASSSEPAAMLVTLSVPQDRFKDLIAILPEYAVVIESRTL